MAMIHGGQLSIVAKQYQIPESQWLDLSTGISPFSYPIPEIPNNIWQDLPSMPDSLINVAKHYYQAEHCWPLAGSQSLIEKLPMLWNNEQKKSTDCTLVKHVYLPQVGYKEHQLAWNKAGYFLHFYQNHLPNVIEAHSVVVVINPNNPLTDTFSIDELTTLHNLCQQQQALLIIDEAFADILAPECSFIPHIKDTTENVIVLRSFGKFFGLAGLRIGFVCSSNQWCTLIEKYTGPWSVNGPALYIAEQALSDKQWQKKQNNRLKKQSQKQQRLLKQNLGECRIESNSLFITVFLNNAPEMYEKLCRQGVYIRLTDERNALRFGIADDLQLKILRIAFNS